MKSAEKIIMQPGQIAARVKALKHPVVFTNGCFDILHRGHVTYLEEAAEFGASLIVGLNTDDSIRRLNKGPDRPINTLEDRAAVLAVIGFIDLVIPFNEDTPIDLIKQIRPDHLVKGGDYNFETIVGSEFVASYGGQVHAIPFRHERSVSILLDRIRTSG